MHDRSISDSSNPVTQFDQFSVPLREKEFFHFLLGNNRSRYTLKSYIDTLYQRAQRRSAESFSFSVFSFFWHLPPRDPPLSSFASRRFLSTHVHGRSSRMISERLYTGCPKSFDATCFCYDASPKCTPNRHVRPATIGETFLSTSSFFSSPSRFFPPRRSWAVPFL